MTLKDLVEEKTTAMVRLLAAGTPENGMFRRTPNLAIRGLLIKGFTKLLSKLLVSFRVQSKIPFLTEKVV